MPFLFLGVTGGFGVSWADLKLEPAFIWALWSSTVEWVGFTGSNKLLNIYLPI